MRRAPGDAGRSVNMPLALLAAAYSPALVPRVAAAARPLLCRLRLFLLLLLLVLLLPASHVKRLLHA